MKRLTLLILVLVSFACSTGRMMARDIRCNWTGNNPVNSVDYVLQRQVGTTWTDVGTTKAVTFTVTDATVGAWTLRVVARVTTPDGVLESPPSNVVTVTVGPNAPSVLSVTLI